MGALEPKTPGYAKRVRQLNSAANWASIQTQDLTAEILDRYAKHRSWSEATRSNAHRCAAAHDLNITPTLAVPTLPLDDITRFNTITSFKTSASAHKKRGAAWATLSWHWPASLPKLVTLTWQDLATLEPRPRLAVTTLPPLVGWHQYLQHEYPTITPDSLPFLCRLDCPRPMTDRGAQFAWSKHLNQCDVAPATYDKYRRAAIQAGANPVDRYNRTTGR